MDKGIYTALSGGIAKGHELELIANNIANANTPGFKRDRGTFNEYLTELRRQDSAEGLKREITAATLFEGRPPGDKSFVEMDGVYTDFRQGTLEKTDRPLDLAIEGKGMFEVWTPSGLRYTRQGNLNVSRDGQLVSGSNGFPVLARGAALDTPPEQRFIRLRNEPVQITPEGNVMQGGQIVAVIAVQEFHEMQLLEKVGNSYYRNTNPDNRMPQGSPTNQVNTQIHQGFIEGSNVNAVAEMTKLIEATRAYESHMQAIKTYQEIDGRTVNEIARR